MDTLPRANDVVNKIGGFFFLLWLISLISDILGSYEYKEEFLILSVVMWVIGAFISGLAKDKPKIKKLAIAFRRSGTTLIGLWILLWILKVLGWLEPFWNDNINYLLAFALGGLSLSFLLRALSLKNTSWKIRSAFYSLGFMAIISWICFKILDMFKEYHDSLIVGGIVLIGIGYIVGASKKSHDYAYFEDKKENISTVMKEVKEVPQPTEIIKVLTNPLKVGDRSYVSFDEGTVFIDISQNDENIGSVLFGLGTIQFFSNKYSFKQKTMGYYYGYGPKWPTNIDFKEATSDDLEKIGLDEKDIKELAGLLATGDTIAPETLKDFKLKMKDKKTEINLPFLKVLESAEGDYVKFGPFEVADLKGKGARLRIGDYEYMEGMDEEKDVELTFKIYSIEGLSTFKLYPYTELKTKENYFLAKDGEIIITKGQVKYGLKDENENLESPDLEISLGLEYSISAKKKKFDLEISGDNINIGYKDKKNEIKNKELALLFKKMIDKAMPDIISDTMANSDVALNQLIIHILEELHS